MTISSKTTGAALQNQRGAEVFASPHSNGRPGADLPPKRRSPLRTRCVRVPRGTQANSNRGVPHSATPHGPQTTGPLPHANTLAGWHGVVLSARWRCGTLRPPPPCPQETAGPPGSMQCHTALSAFWTGDRLKLSEFARGLHRIFCPEHRRPSDQDIGTCLHERLCIALAHSAVNFNEHIRCPFFV